MLALAALLSLVAGAEPKTALVGVEVDAGGQAKVRFTALKRFPFRAARGADADLRVVVEGAGSGEARLRAGQSHGDVVTLERDVVLVKVPYVTGRETVRVERRAPDGTWHVTDTTPLTDG